MKTSGGSLGGHVYNADAGLAWYRRQNVGVGAEYSYSRIRVLEDRKNYLAVST